MNAMPVFPNKTEFEKTLLSPGSAGVFDLWGYWAG
jgi:hypothetical protein